MQLTTHRGETVIVDDDIDMSVTTGRVWSTQQYPMVYVRNVRKTIAIHKVIMGNPPYPGLVIDHINGNRFDNRRCNLRWCTARGNALNRKVRGFFMHRNKGGRIRYRVRVKTKTGLVDLGRFDTPVEAAAAYQKHYEQHGGDFRPRVIT